MNSYVYIHVCCINNWRDIISKFLIDIKDSGLYEKITKIKCNILTDNNDNLSDIIFHDAKIEIIGINNDIGLYEQSTLNLLYEHALNDDFKVLYIHTKGVKHNNTNICVTDWVKYLCYFNIYKHEICMNELENYDVVGVNLQELPELHYSGNFWWSTSNYIRKLNKLVYEHYCSTEFWITKEKNGNYLSLWLSNIDHYMQRYEEDNYINKPINIDSTYKFIFNPHNLIE